MRRADAAGGRLRRRGSGQCHWRRICYANLAGALQGPSGAAAGNVRRAELPPLLRACTFSQVDLRAAGLSSLENGVFADMRSLKRLDLSWNSIAEIPDRAFDGLVGLSELHLHENQLSTLPDDVHDMLDSETIPTLQTLSIAGNKITYLPTALYQKLVDLQRR